MSIIHSTGEVICLTVIDLENRLKALKEERSALNNKDYWEEDDYARNQYLHYAIKHFEREKNKKIV